MELTDIKHAPIWRRFLSFISDVALWTMGFFVFSIPFRRYGIYNEQRDYLIMFWCFIFLLYQIIMIATNKGRTIGGVWFATKVISIKQNKISFLQSTIRSLIMLCLLATVYISGPFLGIITFVVIILMPVLFKPFKSLNQFVWDNFSKTYVIKISIEEESKQ